jgi:EpsI family protein
MHCADISIKEFEIDLEVHTAELRSVSENQLLVWQWYWVNGLWTSSDFMAKLYTAYSRIIGHGDDSAVVIVYTLKKSTEATSSILEDFVKIAAPEIEKTIEQTMRIE